jgi:hypothetical protein
MVKEDDKNHRSWKRRSGGDMDGKESHLRPEGRAHVLTPAS